MCERCCSWSRAQTCVKARSRLTSCPSCHEGSLSCARIWNCRCPHWGGPCAVDNCTGPGPCGTGGEEHRVVVGVERGVQHASVANVYARPREHGIPATSVHNAADGGPERGRPRGRRGGVTRVGSWIIPSNKRGPLKLFCTQYAVPPLMPPLPCHRYVLDYMACVNTETSVMNFDAPPCWLHTAGDCEQP